MEQRSWTPETPEAPGSETRSEVLERPSEALENRIEEFKMRSETLETRSKVLEQLGEALEKRTETLARRSKMLESRIGRLEIGEVSSRPPTAISDDEQQTLLPDKGEARLPARVPAIYKLDPSPGGSTLGGRRSRRASSGLVTLKDFINAWDEARESRRQSRASNADDNTSTNNPAKPPEPEPDLHRVPGCFPTATEDRKKSSSSASHVAVEDPQPSSQPGPVFQQVAYGALEDKEEFCPSASPDQNTALILMGLPGSLTYKHLMDAISQFRPGRVRSVEIHKIALDRSKAHVRFFESEGARQLMEVIEARELRVKGYIITGRFDYCIMPPADHGGRTRVVSATGPPAAVSLERLEALFGGHGLRPNRDDVAFYCAWQKDESRARAEWHFRDVEGEAVVAYKLLTEGLPGVEVRYEEDPCGE